MVFLAVQDFALIAIHTSPSSAAEEVALLDVVADEISSAWNLQVSCAKISQSYTCITMPLYLKLHPC